MSHDWSTPDDLGGFDGSFAFDTINDFLPENHDPAPDDSWLSAFIVDDGLSSNPNDGSRAPSEAYVTSRDIDTACNTTVNTIEPAQDIWNPGGSSYDELDSTSDLFDAKVLGISYWMAADQEMTNVQVATHEHPFPLDHISLESSMEESPRLSGTNRLAERSIINEKKFQRAKISSDTRLMLNAHFNVSPYPDDGELAVLSGNSGLEVRVIKRWFTNTRSRKQYLQSLVNPSVDSVALKQDHTDSYPQSLSPPRSLFGNFVDGSDRCSPDPSSDSLERYLASPESEEAVPTATIEAAIQHNSFMTSLDLDQRSPMLLPIADVVRLPLCDACHVRRISSAGKSFFCDECGSNVTRFYKESEHHTSRASSSMAEHSGQLSLTSDLSVMGSDASASSCNSYASFNSRISVNSRASRRGRKRWGQALTPPAALRRRCLSPVAGQNALEIENTTSNAGAPYFCTSADCDKSFRYRSEWARHEEAVHHEPYQWICCLNMDIVMRLPHCFVCGEADVLLSHLAEFHFRCCSTKSEEDRTFMREDQLAQHMKRAHGSKTSPRLSVPKVLLSAWKIANPSLSASSLHCGFCGMTFATWEQRQDHVFDHLRHSICKWAWWPGRLPVVPTNFSVAGYTCSACSASFPSIDVAFQEHAACAIYSCRYLHDWHALFENEPSLVYPYHTEQALQCRLCHFHINFPRDGEPSPVCLLKLREHAKSHNLRACHQEIHTNKAEFQQHMRVWHGATHADGTNWHIMRFIEKEGEDYMVRTWMELQDCLLCDTKASKAHGVCSVGTPIHRAEDAEKEPRKEPLMWRPIGSMD